MAQNAFVSTPKPVPTQKTDKEIATDLVSNIEANKIPQVVEILETYNNFRYINTESDTGITALQAAITVHSVDIVTRLLKVPDIDANRNNSRPPNNTPLILAVSNPYNEQTAEIVRLLCWHANIDKNKPNHDGFTPLMVAVQQNNLEFVNILLEASWKDPAGITAMLLNDSSSRKIQTQWIRYIFSFIKTIDVNADIIPKHDVGNAFMGKDITALSIAIRNNNINIVERLLMEDNIKIPQSIKPFQTLQQFKAKVDPEQYNMNIFLLLDAHAAQVAAPQAGKYATKPGFSTLDN
jgi:ankyrin repeat protein